MVFRGGKAGLKFQAGCQKQNREEGGERFAIHLTASCLCTQKNPVKYFQQPQDASKKNFSCGFVSAFKKLPESSTLQCEFTTGAEYLPCLSLFPIAQTHSQTSFCFNFLSNFPFAQQLCAFFTFPAVLAVRQWPVVRGPLTASLTTASHKACGR